jgi:hypothetical protein
MGRNETIREAVDDKSSAARSEDPPSIHCFASSEDENSCPSMESSIIHDIEDTVDEHVLVTAIATKDRQDCEIGIGGRDNSQRCLELLYSAVAQLMRFGDIQLVPYAYDFLRNMLSFGGIQDIQACAAAAA